MEPDDADMLPLGRSERQRKRTKSSNTRLEEVRRFRPEWANPPTLGTSGLVTHALIESDHYTRWHRSDSSYVAACAPRLGPFPHPTLRQ